MLDVGAVPLGLFTLLEPDEVAPEEVPPDAPLMDDAPEPVLAAPEPVVWCEVDGMDAPEGVAVLEVGAVPLGLFILPEVDEAPLEEPLLIELSDWPVVPHAVSAKAHAKGRIHLVIKMLLI